VPDSNTNLNNSDRLRAERVAELRAKLHSMATLQTVPSGILETPSLMSPPLAGGPADVPLQPLGRMGWQQIYSKLHRGALSPAAMPDLNEVDGRAKQSSDTGLIPIAIGHYRYHTATPDFAAHLETYTAKGGALATPEPHQLGGMLQEKTAFFAAPLLPPEYHMFFPVEPKHRSLVARYVVPSTLYLSNAGAPPSNLEIDLDDGKGYRSVALDQPISAQYNEAGDRHIRVRAMAAGQAMHTLCLLPLTPPTAPPPDDFWQFTAYKTHTDVNVQGHAWVYYGQGHTHLEKPVIVSEGFPGGYALGTLWDILNEQQFATRVLNSGHDLVILGYNQGTLAIESNAGVVIAAIQIAIQKRHGNTPLVVGGASMGGLICRYALTYMESQGMDHQTRLYFSFDSPHLGALVPASLLYFANYLAEDGTDCVNQLLTSTAAQEMLIYSLTDYDDPMLVPSPLRQTFCQNLAKYGDYPKRCRRVGVANGAGNGAGNGVPGSADMLTFRGYEIGATLYSSPGVEGTFDSNTVADLRYDWFCFARNDNPFDGAPGGTDDFMNQVAQGLIQQGFDPTVHYPKSCFMPMISALAIDGLDPLKPADLYYNAQAHGAPSVVLQESFFGETNDPHVTVTKDIAQWLLDRLDQGTTTAAGGA